MSHSTASCFMPLTWPQRDAVFPPPPPPPSDDHPAWTDESWASPLDATRRIFCNRSLNMRTISAIGFDMVGHSSGEGLLQARTVHGTVHGHSGDMTCSKHDVYAVSMASHVDCDVVQDYTMAQYRPETFEVLAHTETVKKLVTQLGYPEVHKNPAVLLNHERKTSVA